MKKIFCLITMLYGTLAWSQTDYRIDNIDMDYEDLNGIPGRVILFDGNEGTYDDQEAQVDLPFSFKFYGQEYSSLRVSTNGYLVFPESEWGDEYTNQPLPTTDNPNGIIAVFWDDLEVAQNDGTTDQISYVIQGEAPNRVLIVDYRSVRVRGSSDDAIWTQAKLYEGSNVIELHYDDTMSETGDGATNATIGLEHPCGCRAARGPNYNNDNDTVPAIAYRYTPVPQYYTREEINMSYEDLDGMPGRQMLFDVNEGNYDDQEAQVDLPFSFKFYGQEYSSLRVSTNGYLVFPESDLGVEPVNESLPNNDNSNGIIAVFWDDLEVTQNNGTADQISYVIQGEAPNRVLIVDYRSVSILASNDDYIWAQAKLYESSHVIELHYDNLSETDDGATDATIGMEHPCGCIAEPGPNYDATNEVIPDVAYRYTPNNDLIFMNGFE